MTIPLAHVIGDPIEQSKSPIIHKFWLSKLGIPGNYTKRHVKPGGLADYLEEMRADSCWRGCNVTMPHKQRIMDHLDQLDPVARAVGAVNTVVRQDDGSLIGFNTDVEGFLEPLSDVLAQSHLFRMARIIGTGGAARAIVAGLAASGFTMVLAGRNPDKAASLLGDLAPGAEHYVADLAHFADPTAFEFDDRQGCLDLIVNASPLGMKRHSPLHFDWSHAPPGSIAYDIVTDPARTDFLELAEKNGATTIDGLSMLIGQAAAAFEKFFQQAPPRQDDPELRGLLTQ